ncbi:MAG: serine/threonine protein kinase [Pseudomonadota bacterium]
MNRSDNPGFSTLLPDDILNAVESVGYQCNGDFLALNSYENRVYRVTLDDATRVVVKFYRPQRWSNDAIAEEHDYACAMAALDLPVVPPRDHNGATLHEFDQHRFAVFDCVGGHWPALDSSDTLKQLGRLTGRIHLAGAQARFSHRGSVSLESHGYDARDYLLDNEIIPESLEEAYATLADDILEHLDEQFDDGAGFAQLRIHNDLHPGNVLEDGDRLHIVDTDDVANGVAIQDLWMFLSGNEDEQSGQLSALLEGYESFRNFDIGELSLIEPLRTLRLMHYAAWLARRWEDPAFQRAFPWFDSVRYWNEHILSLREQLALLSEPPVLRP